MREILFALPSSLLIGSANAILKWRIGYLNSQGIAIYNKLFYKFIFDPYIALGAIITALSIFWWLSIVSYVRIGIVYPLIQSGAILTTLILSLVLLKETIPIHQYFGIFLITLGIIVLSK